MLNEKELENAISDFIEEVIERLAREEPEKAKQLLKNLKEKEVQHDTVRKSN